MGLQLGQPWLQLVYITPEDTTEFAHFYAKSLIRVFMALLRIDEQLLLKPRVPTFQEANLKAEILSVGFKVMHQPMARTENFGVYLKSSVKILCLFILNNVRGRTYIKSLCTDTWLRPSPYIISSVNRPIGLNITALQDNVG